MHWSAMPSTTQCCGGSIKNAVVITLLVLGICARGNAQSEETKRPAQHDSELDGRQESPNGFLLQAAGDMFVPIGAWQDHPYQGKNIGEIRYPDDLILLGNGWGGSIELGYQYKRLTFGFLAGMTALSTSEWEQFAEKMDSQISAVALHWNAIALVGFELLVEGPYRMEARFGLGYLQVWGEEENHDYRLDYTYSFLGPAFAMLSGLGNRLNIAKGVDLVLLNDFIVGAPGIERSDGKEKPYLGFRFSLGVRLWPFIWSRV